VVDQQTLAEPIGQGADMQHGGLFARHARAGKVEPGALAQACFGWSRMAPVRNRMPAAPAPISGAMMNSQSFATATGFEPTPTSAGPIERAGLTDVPVMLMPTRWMASSVSPMARPAKPVGANGWVTPRMHTRNRNVPTTSNTKAETTLYSPRLPGPQPFWPSPPFQP